jgi:hypothetical protein
VATDGSFLPAAPADSTPARALPDRLGGQPRNRSSSSPRRRMLLDVPDGRSGPKETHWGGAFSRGDQRHGGRRERGKRWATPAAVRRGPDNLPHDPTRRLRPARTWPWFVQPGEKACHESRPPGCRHRRLQPRHRFSIPIGRAAAFGRRGRAVLSRPNRRSALARIEQAPTPRPPRKGAPRGASGGVVIGLQLRGSGSLGRRWRRLRSKPALSISPARVDLIGKGRHPVVGQDVLQRLPNDKY